MNTNHRKRTTELSATSRELSLIGAVSSAFRTKDRCELDAELTRTFLVLKASHRDAYTSSYIARSLWNRALNWIRDQRRTANREVPLRDALLQSELIPELNLTNEAVVAFHLVWDELDEAARATWIALVESHGNRTSAAQCLGHHRNTVHRCIVRIRHILARHGFHRETTLRPR